MRKSILTTEVRRFPYLFCEWKNSGRKEEDKAYQKSNWHNWILSERIRKRRSVDRYTSHVIFLMHFTPHDWYAYSLQGSRRRPNVSVCALHSSFMSSTMCVTGAFVVWEDTNIHDRFLRDEVYRESQLTIGWLNKCKESDRIARWRPYISSHSRGIEKIPKTMVSHLEQVKAKVSLWNFDLIFELLSLWISFTPRVKRKKLKSPLLQNNRRDGIPLETHRGGTSLNGIGIELIRFVLNEFFWILDRYLTRHFSHAPCTCVFATSWLSVSVHVEVQLHAIHERSLSVSSCLSFSCFSPSFTSSLHHIYLYSSQHCFSNAEVNTAAPSHNEEYCTMVKKNIVP